MSLHSLKPSENGAQRDNARPASLRVSRSFLLAINPLSPSVTQVDEFLQPLSPNATLLSAVAAAGADAGPSATGLHVSNVWFFERAGGGGGRAGGNATLQTQRYAVRSRDAQAAIGKCIVRPERALAFSVHQVRVENSGLPVTR